MEVAQQRIFSNDQRHDRRSSSNNLYPSSQQSRKVSIGITVEASAKSKSEARREDEVRLPATEKKVAYSQGKSVQLNTVDTEAACNVKQVEVTNHKKAALFSTQILHSEMAATKTVKFYSNQTSILQPDGLVHKELNHIVYGRKNQKSGNAERTEEFAFATTQGIHVSDKEEGGEKTGKTLTGNEALRMKLWEILGTSSSQRDQISDLRAHATGTDNLLDSKGVLKDEPIKHNQYSDTIETDSESPKQNFQRPVTRSLTRRRAQTRTQPKLQCKNNKCVELRPSSSPSFKLKHQEKNIFAFDEAEGRRGTLRWPLKNSSSMLKRKFLDKSTKIQPRKICFSRSTISKKSSQSSGRDEIPPLPEKTAQQSNTNAGSESSHSLNHRDGFHHSPVKMKTDKQKDSDNPPSPKSADVKKSSFCPSIAEGEELLDSPLTPNNLGLKEKFESSPSPNNNESQDNFHSPTFAMNSPKETEFCNPPSTDKTPEGDGFHSSKLAERSLRNLRTSTLGSVGSSLYSRSSSDDREFKDSSIPRVSLDIEGKDVEKRLSLSSMEAQDHERLEEDELVEKGSGVRKNWIPESDCSKKPPFMLRRNIRLCSQEGDELRELDPISFSPKGTEENNGFKKAPEKTQENGLARAVAQFELVLEKFQTKMKSRTRQKSSEILTSVADRIHLHLQSIESQIQTDIEKFAGLSKSKRKRLESRFQDQQKHLKLMHSKFKEEINHHLQECESTLEEFEVYETELQGDAERQKASHRKLLSKVEEEIEVQLNDAKRSIAAIHQAARKNMQGLKHALSECLSEGLLS